MGDEIFRLVMYITGGVSALVLATRMFALTHPLAKCFGVMAVGWATTSVVLILGLIYIVQGGSPPSWHYLLRTGNALLIGTVPAVILFAFERLNGDTGE